MPPFDPSKAEGEVCPFCTIASTFPIYDPQEPLSDDADLSPSRTATSTFLALSTPHCLAFLDILPLSPGHLLLTTRAHREKISDVTEVEAEEMGRWVSVLSRVLAGTTGVWDWNVVQNNGAAAAQVVGHVHFHIIPRPALTDELRNKSFTMFGRGQRSELDEDEARKLARILRRDLARELRRIRIGNAKGRL